MLVRKKSGLYRLYNQEYELDKKLQGRMVFEIVIAPDGKISSVEVLSNTVDSPTLEQVLVDHLKNHYKKPNIFDHVSEIRKKRTTSNRGRALVSVIWIHQIPC